MSNPESSQQSPSLRSYEGILGAYMMHAITHPLPQHMIEYAEAHEMRRAPAFDGLNAALAIACDPPLAQGYVDFIPDEVQESDCYRRLTEPACLQRSPARLAARALVRELPDSYEFDEKLVKDTHDEMTNFLLYTVAEVRDLFERMQERGALPQTLEEVDGHPIFAATSQATNAAVFCARFVLATNNHAPDRAPMPQTHAELVQLAEQTPANILWAAFARESRPVDERGRCPAQPSGDDPNERAEWRNAFARLIWRAFMANPLELLPVRSQLMYGVRVGDVV